MIYFLGVILFVVAAGAWAYLPSPYYGNVSLFFVAVGFVMPFFIALVFVAKRRDDRSLFLKWLARSTSWGRCHYCLNCWHLVPDSESDACSNCSDPVCYFEYKGEGAPIPRIDPEQHGQPPRLADQPFPRKRLRDKCSTVLQNKDLEKSMAFGCLVELSPYIIGFALLGLMAWAATILGAWWSIVVGGFAVVTVIAVVVWAIWRDLTEPKRLRRRMLRDYPDGYVPWCIYCDNDLRGLAAHFCPICSRQVCKHEFDKDK